MKTLNDDPLVLAETYNFQVEPAYFEQGLTDDAQVLLRRDVVEMLKKAERCLPSGLRFKIWDGFRTTAVQNALYSELYKKLEQEHADWSDHQVHKATQEFVADPTKDAKFAAPHNTGAAVDLTIIDSNRDELPMGTGFDHFDVESYTFHFQDSSPGSEEAQWHENRMVLYNALIPLGFFNFPDEWWHFSYGDREWAKKYKRDIIYPSAEEDLFPLS